MDKFEQIRYEGHYGTYGYYKIHKLQNNQTIAIYFNKFEYPKYNEYAIFLAIANKKKHIKQFLSEEKDVLTGKETGKCGLEGLIWAKNQIIEFEESIKCKNGDIISVNWMDNRRRKVYEYGLKKLGFIIGYRDGKKCLYKKVMK